MAKQNILNNSKLKKAQKAIKSGKFNDAVRILSQLCKRDASNLSNWLLLASAQGQMNNFQGVIECSHKVLSLEPKNTIAMNYLGNAYSANQQYNEAIQYYSKSLELNPDDISTLYNLASLFQSQNHFDKALNVFQQLINLKPDHFDALVQLTKICTHQGYFTHAIPYFEKLNELKPDNFELTFHLARCFILSKQVDNARDTLHKSLKLTDKPSDVYYLLADNELHSNQKDHLEKSLHYLSLALKADPNNIMASTAEAEIWYRQGDFSKAHCRLNELINAGHLNNEIVISYAALCRHFDDCNYVIELGEKLLDKSSGLSAIQRQSLHFSLAKIHDKASRYTEAFKHFQQGNDLENETYRPKVETDYVNRTINACIKTDFKAATLQTERAIFIVGMPRSGTTLAEQIIASHRDIVGAGELMEIQQINNQFILNEFDYKGMLHGNAKNLSVNQLNKAAQHYLDKLSSFSDSALRITDKMPQNYLMLGFIAQLFPQAKIIHCSRHPLDTILSNYFQHFTKDQSYSFKLENIAHYYREYQRLMTHWKETLNISIMELPYHQLVDDFESTCRQLINFTGLDWDEKCLDFHQSKRTVITASYDQVRSPIYKSSLNRWKHYEEFLQPLKTNYADFFQ